MTLNELKDIYWLPNEIRADEKRLEELEAKIPPGSPDTSGMPRAAAPGSKVERLAIKHREALENLRQKRERLDKLEAFIYGIPDSLTRQIFVCKFVRRMSWKTTCRETGADSVESVKKVCYRYLERSQEDEGTA